MHHLGMHLVEDSHSAEENSVYEGNQLVGIDLDATGIGNLNLISQTTPRQF